MAKADRTPKKIAGLKLPKAIREAPAIKALLATPEGRTLLEEALIEGAVAAAAKVIAAHSAKLAGAKAAKPAEKAAKTPDAEPVISHAAPPDDLADEAPQSVLLPEANEPVIEPVDPPHRTGAAD